MEKTVWCLAAIYFSTYVIHGSRIDSPCDGDDWVAYKDEKCFKLVEQNASRDQAEKICKQLVSITSSSVPTLASIKSAAEQEFLTKYVSNSSHSNNIWIGAKRRQNRNTEFEWTDGSVIDGFTNWAKGSPAGESRRDCVHMQLIIYSNTTKMEWSDVSCTIGNWVLCQKLQTWSFNYLQQTILDSREELNEVKAKLEVLESNPVPIDFIYVQLPGQPEPYKLWGTVYWIDITHDYNGLFFRVLGGSSEQFGVTQEESSPRLIQFTRFDLAADVYSAQVSANGAFSQAVSSGAWPSGGSRIGLRFMVSAAEVRPRNTAVRIWKRT